MRDDRQYRKLQQILLDQKNINVEYHYRCFTCKLNLMFRTRTQAVKKFIDHEHKNIQIIHVINSNSRLLSRKEIHEWKEYMEDEGLIPKNL